jgi:hypothetical protein
MIICTGYPTGSETTTQPAGSIFELYAVFLDPDSLKICIQKKDKLKNTQEKKTKNLLALKIAIGTSCPLSSIENIHIFKHEFFHFSPFF